MKLQKLITYLQRIAKDEGLKFEDCLLQAWNEIKDRKGKLIDGVWVKEEDLKKARKNLDWLIEEMENE